MNKKIRFLTILGIGLFVLASCGGGTSESVLPSSDIPSVGESVASTSISETPSVSVADSVSVPVTKHTVTFDVNGGLGTVASQSCDAGTFATEPTEEVTKAHYTLLGWTLVKDTLPVIDFGATAINAATTLYAYWSINEYSVTFNLNYLTGEDDVFVTELVPYNGTLIEPDVDPTRDHHTFEGWYIDEACETPFVFTTLIVDNTDLYAKWDIEQIAVMVETFGGTGVAPTIFVDYGTKLIKPETDPVRVNSLFENWYADELCITPFDFEQDITEPVTLYAKYETAYQIASLHIDLTGAILGMRNDFEIATTGLGFVVLEGTTVEVRGQIFAINLAVTNNPGIPEITGYDDVTLEFKVYRESDEGIMEYLDPSTNGHALALKLVSSDYATAIAALGAAISAANLIEAMAIYEEMQKMYNFDYDLDDGGMIDLFQMCVVNSTILQTAFAIDPSDMSKYFYPLHISVAEPGNYSVRIWLETDVGANDIAYKQINFTA